MGTLKKDAQGNILGMKYNPVENPNYFEFVLLDEKQKEETVYYFAPKPPDLEKSEKVVIIGNYKNEKFVVNQILLKCPSKYEKDEIKN